MSHNVLTLGFHLIDYVVVYMKNVLAKLLIRMLLAAVYSRKLGSSAAMGLVGPQGEVGYRNPPRLLARVRPVLTKLARKDLSSSKDLECGGD